MTNVSPWPRSVAASPPLNVADFAFTSDRNSTPAGTFGLKKPTDDLLPKLAVKVPPAAPPASISTPAADVKLRPTSTATLAPAFPPAEVSDCLRNTSRRPRRVIVPPPELTSSAAGLAPAAEPTDRSRPAVRSTAPPAVATGPATDRSEAAPVVVTVTAPPAVLMPVALSAGVVTAPTVTDATDTVPTVRLTASVKVRPPEVTAAASVGT